MERVWGLDLYFGAETGLKSATFATALLTWSKQGRDRRFRLYQSGHTLGSSLPAAFFPPLKKVALQPPVHRESPTDVKTWGEDWRDPGNHWSVSFFSKPYLKAQTPETGVTPVFIAASAADELVHGFTAVLGFGHAASLRLG